MGDRLVLGLGGTVDYEIEWSSSTLTALIVEHDIHASDISGDVVIDSERNLIIALLSFLRQGSGGERYVTSSEIVTGIAGRFAKAITLGGTPVRAALAMDKLGVATTVHLVSIDDHVRRLLPLTAQYVCSATEDTTDPHLIVQFHAGDRIQAGDIDICAPQANRVIFTNDPPSRELVLSEELPAVLTDARVFLISGFNVIQTEELARRRTRELKHHMTALPADALVIYEDSGFHVPRISTIVREELQDVISVHSLNEDEMQIYLDRPLDLLDPEVMSAALTQLYDLIGVPTLVVHTKFWALALGAHAQSYVSALHGGITMASARYCHGDHFTQADYDTLAALPRDPGGQVLARSLADRLDHPVCCVPANTLTVDHATTIGLGDTFIGGFIAALPTTSISNTPTTQPVITECPSVRDAYPSHTG